MHKMSFGYFIFLDLNKLNSDLIKTFQKIDIKTHKHSQVTVLLVYSIYSAERSELTVTKEAQIWTRRLSIPPDWS